jgi:uncharacterized protein YcaQ
VSRARPGPPGDALQLTWAQVAAWRMARHHLVQRAPADQALQVVGELGGLQAQVMSAAELGLWARVEELPPGTVARALWDDRTLVKTWAVRGTLHLLPTAEYPLWQAALSTYRHYLQGAWFRFHGITREELEQLLAAVGEALEGQYLTREELAGVASQITGSAELGGKLTESWGSMLKPASFRGLLCFGPDQGRNVRFTHPRTWLKLGDAVDPDWAMREVARRYLAAYGPATREDLGHWWGLAAAPAGKLLDSLGDEIILVEVEGERVWLLAVHREEIRQAAPTGAVALLPAFDQYVIAASRHAGHLMPGDFRGRVYRPQGWISQVLLVDGQMLGVWKHERKGNRLLVQLEPFVDLPASVRRPVEQEAERLATFLGGSLEMTWAAAL